jgi:site-specific recombinase XerD
METTKKRKENDMTAVVTRAGQDIKEMAATLAAFPSPDKWTNEQKAQAVQFAALLDTAQKMIAAAGLAGIDYAAEKQTFLENAGRTNSAHTRTGYRAALARLDAWTATQGITPLELTPAQADDFIYSLKAEGRAAASIRLDTAAASSFFTFLHRRHTAIDNPFRGTKARPAKRAAKKTEIPDAKEVKALIAALPPMEAAAAAVMAYRGLRAGALPTLSIAGRRFTGHSKGKDIAGELPPAALKAIQAAALPLRSPFAAPEGYKAANWTNTLEKRIAAKTKELHQAGKMKAAYSCHDLRHFYAVTDYQKNHDIHRLCKLLDHASIQVTETYLKTLGVTE